MLDVGLAFLLVGLTIRIQVIARDTPDAVAQRVSYAIYRLAANLLLVLLVSFFIFGERIKWSTLLPGLAWRAWLLLYILPAGVSCWLAEGQGVGLGRGDKH